MVDIETVRFVGMLNELAIRFDGEKGTYAFYKDNNAIVLNSRLNKVFCLNYLIYDDKDGDDLGYETDDATMYPVIKDISFKDGRAIIESYYEGVFAVVKKGEKEVYCVLAFTPKSENVDDGHGMFVVENGYWYFAD